MNEPWNPYDVMPAARSADPAAAGARIDALPVSERWKRRFRLIAKAGGPRLPNLGALTFGERMAVMFSVLGLLFGPLYLLCKGLWRPALAYSLIIVAVGFAALMLGLEMLARGVGYGAAVLCANRACALYYRQRVLGERPWL
ncbi:DUF2628 domain-containing protein [Vulcaniibacterium thermophilum]|uniref:Membrane protein n=1 Tax=Vulcaniibacterium thermophilum TaxID=1169913 RepID=A0A919D9S7_9GAMM|nr:DUF2628 domain-containing protein [Vulcaniibacterium thermophilum]GHE27697.1 membrane protein [Vulcaniibacterium thermophilum]